MVKLVTTRLRDLIPDYYEDVYDMDILLSIQQTVLDRFLEKMNQAQRNIYVMLADSEGLAIWEHMLGILPVPDLAARRLAIITSILPPKPISLRYLNELLGTLDIHARISVIEFYVEITVTTSSHHAMERLNFLLNRYLPANLAYRAINTTETYEVGTVKAGTAQMIDVSVQTGGKNER